MTFLTVLLTVLKIIGIVIGGIIGLILLLLLWILLSPVRYKGRIKYDGKPDINVRMSYLCHIVSAFFVIDENGSRFDFKIFGKSMSDRKKKPPRKSRTKRSRKSGEITAKETVVQERKERPAGETLPDVKMTDNAAGLLEKNIDKPDIQDEFRDDHKRKNKKSVFKRLEDIYNNLKAKIAEFKKKAARLIEKKDRLFEEIENKDNREAVSFLLVLLKKLLKHILPRKHKIYICFGTGDPAKTGEFLGLMYAFAALMGLNLEVESDFENKVMTCDIPFKGRVCILRVGIWILQGYRNKKLRALIYKIRNR